MNRTYWIEILGKKEGKKEGQALSIGSSLSATDAIYWARRIRELGGQAFIMQQKEEESGN